MTPRATWRVVGLVATLALLVGALPSALALTFEQRGGRTIDLPAAAGLQRLVLDGDAGTVRVRVAEPGEPLTATARSTYSLLRPEITHVDQAGTVTLRSDCRFVSVGCRVAWELVVPAEVALDLRFGLGRVRACDLAGPVSIDVSTGSVDLCRLESDEVDVSASTATVAIDFAAPPQRVSVETAVGDVSVSVPHDGTAYAVRTSVDVGAVDNRIPIDPDSDRVVDVSANVGDLALATR